VTLPGYYNIYMQTYKGKFKPKNRSKYVGDVNNIVYRSLWERNAFRWVDTNASIVAWNSEETVIPYLCETDQKVHRYFLDLWFKTTNGEVYIIEIKPKSQTLPPKKPKGGNRRRYMSESLTYIKNQSKWKAAQQFAVSKGWHFQIWTEDTMRELGIKILKG